MRFLVWDEINNEREDAKEIEAANAANAAVAFAGADRDGYTDGLYTDRGAAISDLEEYGQPIVVEDETGVCRTYLVGVIDFEPVYGTRLREHRG